ncbi:hypothetical protein SAMN06269250_5521 [Spirosoma fluviale]|uniref:Uncharacterized protein n=1 Tax=Spirosoma fluviale TaxID=1597977 RepID=A0A286GMW6_9BACT|nr:hypothetical protein SAMN06269250_5521 [Spirosoma fluviale]
MKDNKKAACAVWSAGSPVRFLKLTTRQETDHTTIYYVSAPKISYLTPVLLFNLLNQLLRFFLVSFREMDGQ